MVTTHRTFLSWLLYAVAVGFLWATLLYVGIPQLAIASDHSHLTVALLAVYALAELSAARSAWWLSSQRLSTDHAAKVLATGKCRKAAFAEDGDLHLLVTGCDHVTEIVLARTSLLASYARDARSRINGGVPPGVGAHDDALYASAQAGVTFTRFLASRIVWVGILATILGIVIAFWPFLTVGADVEAVRGALGTFFNGIAVAFIPTAASFVFKILLDVNDHILANAADDLVTRTMLITEAHIATRFQAEIAHASA